MLVFPSYISDIRALIVFLTANYTGNYSPILSFVSFDLKAYGTRKFVILCHHKVSFSFFKIQHLVVLWDAFSYILDQHLLRCAGGGGCWVCSWLRYG
jgi:hypothetical protein